MVSLGLWIILGVSGRCLGEFRRHINHKQLNRSRHIKLLPFLPVASDEPKSALFSCVCGSLTVSGSYLGGVWQMSDNI